MFQFPFGTMHQLNLDWFLQQWQQLRQDWIDEEQHIDDSMQDVYDARDAAIQAKDDAVSAKNDAQTAKAAADADALISEGFALGEQNGTPVGAGSPYYQANAKFYSMTAGTYRYLSEAYARGTMGGTPVDPGDAGYEDNAKYYKDAAAASAQEASDDADYVRDHVTDADASALEAEGWAVGEQGGTPVASGSPYYENNAKYYAGEAQQDKDDADAFKDSANQAALRSEGFAVGEQNGTPVTSGSPYYENNAEYYKDLAASVVLSADGAAAQAMIAGDETNTTVTADYPAGSYIRVQGVLYRTTQNIETGDTLTVGTNCEVAVLGDDVQANKNSIDNDLAPVIRAEGSGTLITIPDAAAGKNLSDLTLENTVAVLYQNGKNFFPINIPANVINGTISSGRIASAANARTYAIPVPTNTNFYIQRLAGSAGLTVSTGNKLPAVGDTVRNVQVMSNLTNYQFNTGSDNYILITLSSTSVQATLITLETMISIGSTRKTYEAFTGQKAYTVVSGVPTEPAVTLAGINNFWADDGSEISFTYPADTKMYIDAKIAELQALII